MSIHEPVIASHEVLYKTIQTYIKGFKQSPSFAMMKKTLKNEAKGKKKDTLFDLLTKLEISFDLNETSLNVKRIFFQSKRIKIEFFDEEKITINAAFNSTILNRNLKIDFNPSIENYVVAVEKKNFMNDIFLIFDCDEQSYFYQGKESFSRELNHLCKMVSDAYLTFILLITEEESLNVTYYNTFLVNQNMELNIRGADMSLSELEKDCLFAEQLNDTYYHFSPSGGFYMVKQGKEFLEQKQSQLRTSLQFAKSLYEAIEKEPDVYFQRDYLDYIHCVNQMDGFTGQFASFKIHMFYKTTPIHVHAYHYEDEFVVLVSYEDSLKSKKGEELKKAYVGKELTNFLESPKTTLDEFLLENELFFIIHPPIALVKSVIGELKEIDLNEDYEELNFTELHLQFVQKTGWSEKDLYAHYFCLVESINKNERRKNDVLSVENDWNWYSANDDFDGKINIIRWVLKETPYYVVLSSSCTLNVCKTLEEAGEIVLSVIQENIKRTLKI